MTRETPDIFFRPLIQADLAAALAIQAATYPAFLLEPEAAFASRLTVTAPYCLAAVRDDAMIAYLLAYGWPHQSPAAVGEVLMVGRPIEVLFIHDLAVSSAGRGSGIGRKLIAQAFDMAGADGLDEAELIAVEGAASYWSALGFAETEMSAELAQKVAAYGSDARWMTRKLSLPVGAPVYLPSLPLDCARWF
ncbi:MAG: GNAT family N-acetyltransferase [Hyphomonas sp.]